MAANTAMDAIYSGAATAMQTILMAQFLGGFVGPRSVFAGPLACTPWALMWTMLFMFFLGANAVCSHCKDTIAGCGGGTACPLVTNTAANLAAAAAPSLGTVPTLTHLLPADLMSIFPRSVREGLVGLM